MRTPAIFVIGAMYLCAQPARAPLPPSQRMVVIVSLDGLPAYALDDPRYPMPTLRRLLREGASVKRMRTTNPAFTWPSHTSMMTGLWPASHGVLYNGLPVRSQDNSKEPVRVEPHSDKSVLVQAPTLYDLAHQAGLIVGHVDWVAIEHAPSVDWEFTEWGNPTGPIEKELIDAGQLAPADLPGFDKRSMTLRDQIWTAAALDIIRKHKPNLMLFHPLNLDHTHHRYGAMSEASETAAAFEDDRLKEILDAIESSDLRDRTTLIVLSDHGFKNPTKTIRPNVVLNAAGICAFAVPEGGTAQVYVTDPARRAEVIPQVKAALAKVEGVARILDRTDFPGMGLPDPLKNPRMGDLFVAAKDGYAFGAGSEGQPVVSGAAYGSHGYLNTDPDMDAIFVAWGYGVRAGARLDRAAVVDVGPTVAALLGLQMGKIDGHALTALLQ